MYLLSKVISITALNTGNHPFCSCCRTKGPAVCRQNGVVQAPLGHYTWVVPLFREIKSKKNEWVVLLLDTDCRILYFSFGSLMKQGFCPQSQGMLLLNSLSVLHLKISYDFYVCNKTLHDGSNARLTWTSLLSWPVWLCWCGCCHPCTLHTQLHDFIININILDQQGVGLIPFFLNFKSTGCWSH